MARNEAQEAETEDRDDAPDGPLMDGSVQGVKKMIARGKERGFITYDELNETLPQEQVSSEQIEDVLAQLSEMGINVVEEEEKDDAGDKAAKDGGKGANGAAAGKEEVPTTVPTKTRTTREEDLGRTDDPVRMYLREMGSVELLSREGEIAIAKRIEAGREKMIGSICESPLTIRAIIAWRDALEKEQILLRDVIDLDATHSGGRAKTIPPMAVRMPRRPKRKRRKPRRPSARKPRRTAPPSRMTTTTMRTRVQTSPSRQWKPSSSRKCSSSSIRSTRPTRSFASCRSSAWRG